jgi:hypothetical protein
MQRLREALRIATTLILQGLVAFGLLEAVGHAFDPWGISYYPNTAAWLDTLILEEPIGYRNRPGLAGEYYDVPVSINSLGLRDREIPPDPAPDEHRILIMGDSVPFGVGVPFEDTYGFLLERRLNGARADGDPPVRTINLGTVSYNTEQELVQLETLGLGLHPSLVTLLVTSNDIEPKMWVFEKRSSWLASRGQRSRAVALLMKLYREARGAIARPVQVVSWDGYRDGDPRWETMRASLLEMDRLCREAGVPFVVFTYQLGETAAGELVSAAGAATGTPVVDLDPWRDLRWKSENRTDYLVPNGGFDPNRAGHEIYAELIHEALRDLEVLPTGAAMSSPARPPAPS